MRLVALIAAASLAFAVPVGATAATEPPGTETAWEMTSITLYTPDSGIGERIEVSDLSDYIKRLQVEAASIFAEADGPGASGTIVVIVQPDGRSRVWIVTGEPALDPAISDAAATRLAAVSTPEVTGGPIVFGLNFDAWGGGGAPADAPAPLPESWRRLIPAEGVYIDDAFLAKVWAEG